jgi:glycosyltransferase involved in cell wall biosynthesis
MTDSGAGEQQTPKVSVLIHFLNSIDYLPEAVKSVSWQTFTDWELVLVDGGSTDGSTEFARDLERKYPHAVRAVVYPGPGTLGIYSSRVLGARHARAPVLGLLDSDDEWHPRFLERQYSIYQHVFHSVPGMVYCPGIYWWNDPEAIDRSFVQPFSCKGLVHPPELVVKFLENYYQLTPANSCVMIARDIILEAASLVGTADETMVEDQYLWSFIGLRHPVFLNPEPLTRYLQRATSTCGRLSAEGKAMRLRQGHIRWLLNYVQDGYDGPGKAEMLEGIKSFLEPDA